MNVGRRIPVCCGIDIGSTNTKAVALDENGAVVARASRPTPRDADGLFIDARDLLDSLEELIARACGDAYQLHAISAAGVGEDGVLVDANLQPLTRALAWFDPRRQGIFRALRPELHGDDTFDVDTDPARTLSGWRWARDQAVGSAPCWVALADIATASWTGHPFMSESIASRTAAWRSGDRQWDQERVAVALGSLDLLPPVRAWGDIVGELMSPSLRRRGIVADDAIAVAGGHDHPIGAWGVHQLVPNAVLDSMGTAEVVVATRAVPREPVRRDEVDVAPAIGSTGVTRLRVEELARNVNWAAQDPAVAAKEMERCAAKGSRTIAFTPPRAACRHRAARPRPRLRVLPARQAGRWASCLRCQRSEGPARAGFRGPRRPRPSRAAGGRCRRRRKSD